MNKTEVVGSKITRKVLADEQSSNCIQKLDAIANKMQVVDSDVTRNARLAEFKAKDAEKALADEQRKAQNRDFTQVYPKGWRRLQSLIKTNPKAARIYAFLAEHVDENCGAVVVSQEVLATEIGVHKRTIIRLTQQLEDEKAIVRIRIGIGVYAYCLDPEEVWRSWDDKKELSAFKTKTLVKRTDKANNQVRRKLKFMMES